MPKSIKPLTDTEIKSAKPKANKNYTLHDGDGLQLLIKHTGTKVWEFRYTRPLNKERAKSTFGVYPTISLADARKKKNEARKLLSEGIDPQQYKQQQKQLKLESNANTFSAVANKWWETRRNHITEAYAKDIWRSLEKDVFPQIGNIPVTEIKANVLINALEPVKKRGALETIRRLCQRINEIMTYAMNTGLIDATPSINIAKAFEKPKKQHMLSIRPEQLPELMQTIRLANIELPTRFLFMWQLLTITRPSEAAGTRWDEIDLKENVWRIPAERMKMKREHLVPLTPQAISILDNMRLLSGNSAFVFPSRIKLSQPMNSQTVNAALKRAGLGGTLVSHGLRAIASTALNEQGFSPDVVEAALAHVNKSEIVRAYNRSDYFKKRKDLMKWWSEFVTAADSGSILDKKHIELKIVGG